MRLKVFTFCRLHSGFHFQLGFDLDTDDALTDTFVLHFGKFITSFFVLDHNSGERTFLELGIEVSRRTFGVLYLQIVFIKFLLVLIRRLR